MAAAVGAVNQSPNNRIGPCDITPGFAVTQALVALLASHGGTSLTSSVKGNSHNSSLKRRVCQLTLASYSLVSDRDE